jgi:hypothetical protein
VILAPQIASEQDKTQYDHSDNAEAMQSLATFQSFYPFAYRVHNATTP